MGISDFSLIPIGTWSISRDRDSIIYTPPREWTGEFSFSYFIEDEFGESSSALVRIVIEDPNGFVTANDDSIQISNHQPTRIPVLSNDESVPARLNPDSLIIITSPAHGISQVDMTEIVYLPDRDYVGEDSLVYEICNFAGLCDQATVTINILPDPISRTGTPSQIPIPSRSSSPTRSSDPVPSPSPSKIFLPPEQPSPSRTGLPSSSNTPLPDGIIVNNDEEQIHPGELDPIRPLDNDQGDIDPNTLEIISPPESGDVEIIGEEIIYIPDDDFVGTDTIVYRVCTYKGICSEGTIRIIVLPEESSSSSSGGEEESWCVGGIILWVIGSLIGFGGLHVSSYGWHLLFLMQFIAITGQLGISYPQFYLDYVSCYGWSVLDIPLPWEVEGLNVLVDGLGGHGRHLLELESWVDVIDVGVQDLLWANLFWTAIVLCLVLIVMGILFVIVSLIQYLLIHSEEHQNQVEQQGGFVRSLIIDGCEHFLRALIVFCQLIFLGLNLTGFIIIGYYLRNPSDTNLISPFVIAIIIVLLGLFHLIFITLTYILYRKKRFTNQHIIRVFGVLYLHYRSKIGWWNSVNVARFYAIGAVVGFFLSWGAVQLSLLLIFVVYLIGLVVFRPYKQRSATFVDVILSLVIIIILVLLFVVWGLSDGNASEWILRVIIWLFFVITFWFLKRRKIQSDQDRKLFDEKYLLFGPGGLSTHNSMKDHSSSEDRLL